MGELVNRTAEPDERPLEGIGLPPAARTNPAGPPPPGKAGCLRRRPAGICKLTKPMGSSVAQPRPRAGLLRAILANVLPRPPSVRGERTGRRSGALLTGDLDLSSSRLECLLRGRPDVAEPASRSL